MKQWYVQDVFLYSYHLFLSSQVNNENLREATHDRAIQVLRQTPAVVKMVVFRDEVQPKDEDMYDTFTVELMKKPGKGLGLSIVGRRNDVGVFISDIVSIHWWWDHNVNFLKW